MQNDIIRKRYETLGRIETFGTKHGGAFTPESRGAKLFAKVAEVVDALEKAGAAQLSGTGGFRGGTDEKQFWAGELREDLAAINRTAVAISEAEGLPDFDDQFRMPRGNAYGALLTTARAFLEDATPHKALFVEFELPEDFLEDLAADLAAFEAAKDDQEGARGTQVGGTADLTALSSEGLKLRKQLNAIVRNKFRGNVAVIAEWEAAAHLERPGRAKKEPAA